MNNSYPNETPRLLNELTVQQTDQPNYIKRKQKKKYEDNSWKRRSSVPTKGTGWSGWRIKAVTAISSWIGCWIEPFIQFTSKFKQEANWDGCVDFIPSKRLFSFSMNNWRIPERATGLSLYNFNKRE